MLRRKQRCAYILFSFLKCSVAINL